MIQSKISDSSNVFMPRSDQQTRKPLLYRQELYRRTQQEQQQQQ